MREIINKVGGYKEDDVVLVEDEDKLDTKQLEY
jgi:hypothetical protein